MVKKSSPEESGKDHETINTRLAHPSAGSQAAQGAHGQYSLCRQRGGSFTSTARLSKQQSLPPAHLEPQGLSDVLDNFPRLLRKLLPSP